MTNREYIVKCLNDEVDDGGSSYEATVHYSIACPYNVGDKRAHCYDKGLDYPNREHCVACKYEWLENEVDE